MDMQAPSPAPERAPMTFDLSVTGVTSDLAAGGAGAFLVAADDGEPFGATRAFPTSDAQHCALEALRTALMRLEATCRPGDRLHVRSSLGSQLPMLGSRLRGDAAARATQRAVSDLVSALCRAGIRVEFSGVARTDLPAKLHREALRALMRGR